MGSGGKGFVVIMFGWGERYVWGMGRVGFGLGKGMFLVGER